MPFFIAGKIGQKRSVTPEGFVICHDVPLARTGEQLYRPHEVPPTIRPKPGTDYIRVMRDPEEVFSPAAIASLEGKPITINHPPDLVVTPATYRELAHGHVQNVRRGTGQQINLMLGDLVVKSQEAIDLVEPGLEVSLGYDCGYQELGEDDELPSGLARQHGYLFNHCAFVPEGGRCGPECAVGDHSTCNSNGDRTMANATPDKRSVMDRLRAAFTNKDGATFDQAFAELSTSTANDGSPVPVIVNVNGGGPAAAAALPTADALAGAPDWFKAYATVTDKKFDVLAKAFARVLDRKGKDDDEDKDEKIAALKAAIAAEDDEDKKAELKKQLAALTGDARARRGDADDDDDTEEEKERKRKAREASKDEKILGELELEAPEGVKTGDIAKFVKTGDSAFLEDAFTATIAAAEILAPGIAVPTFDAKMAPAKTFDSICGLRRKALDFAMKDTAGDAIVQAVTGGRTIDTKAAPCGHVRSVFLAAVAMKKQANNAAGGALRSGDTRPAPGKGQIKTIADLNAMNEQIRNPSAKKAA